MAATPEFKVYNPMGEYVAACKHPADAAAIVAAYGDGAEVRLGHGIVLWHEGAEDEQAGNSYDIVSNTCYERVVRWEHVCKVGGYTAGMLKEWNAAMRKGWTLVMCGIVIRYETEQEE